MSDDKELNLQDSDALDNDFESMDRELEALDQDLGQFHELEDDEGSDEPAPVLEESIESEPQQYEESSAEASGELPAFIKVFAYKPLIVTFLVVYFLYLVISSAPASIAAWAVHKAMPNMWLTSVNGTLWKGYAGGAQVNMGGKHIALGRVDWSLNPLSLLILKPCLRFQNEGSGQMASGTICQSPFGSTSVENLNLEAPIALFEDLLPMEASGQLSVQLQEAELSGQKVSALTASYSWQNASVHNGESWMSLGSFGGKAMANGSGGISTEIFEISGPIAVKLNGTWTPGAENWNIQGKVTPGNGAPPQVTQALQVIGEDIGNGAYMISWP